MIEQVIGDILEAKEKYIVHQCNCVSKGSAAGLAYFIFEKFPWADCYNGRMENSIPGTIQICGDGVERYVINLFGQYYPGGSWKEFANDTAKLREEYFACCLGEILKIENLESIAFPYTIGCGIGGGDWEHYLAMLEEFAIKTEAKVKIYNIEKV